MRAREFTWTRPPQLIALSSRSRTRQAPVHESWAIRVSFLVPRALFGALKYRGFYSAGSTSYTCAMIGIWLEVHGHGAGRLRLGCVPDTNIRTMHTEKYP